jgi:predicted dienelactone hydrolase
MAQSHTALQSEIAGLKISYWLPADLTKPAPLILFSHGFTGTSNQSTYLTQAWADRGYIVVAPNHRDAGNFGKRKPDVPFMTPDKWVESTYKNRAEDFQRLIVALKEDPIWTARINWDQVGLAGHSLGGYTVLGLAGAWPSWKITGIKAVLAVSPYATPFFVRGKLNQLNVPVMYQGGTADYLTEELKKVEGAYAKTSGPAYYVEMKDADHFAWTDFRAANQDNIIYYSVAFFDQYLKGIQGITLEKRPGVSDFRTK